MEDFKVLFPGWKRKAVTFSYDDGRDIDKQLVEIFDRYGAKCTLNLHAAAIDKDKRLTRAEVKEISKNHEIAVHMYNHPFPERIPADRMIAEFYEDRKFFEEIVERPVVGMAYANGTYDANVVAQARACGLRYGRTASSAHSFAFPQDFLTWAPTCHHREGEEYARRFVADTYVSFALLYIWGHSFEFERENNWEVLPRILDILKPCDEIWYATNIEIYDYHTAMKSLRLTLDGRHVYNPSATTVYIIMGGRRVALAAGEKFDI